jgi:ubiquitin-like protein Pup
MSEYKQKNTQKSKEADEIDENPQVTPADCDIDAILDEIDSVLEENAEEFVNSYIQRGGQ